MTSSVSKIAEDKGRPVPIAWKPGKVSDGYIMNT